MTDPTDDAHTNDEHVPGDWLATTRRNEPSAEDVSQLAPVMLGETGTGSSCRGREPGIAHADSLPLQLAASWRRRAVSGRASGASWSMVMPDGTVVGAINT
jgi:hypothetical protein